MLGMVSFSGQGRAHCSSFSLKYKLGAYIGFYSLIECGSLHDKIKIRYKIVIPLTKLVLHKIAVNLMDYSSLL